MSLARNSTVPDFHGAEINTLALNIVKDSIASAGVTMVEISLAAVSFGILTVLSFTSIYFLVGRGSLSHANAKILLLSTVLLYLFAGTYLGTLIWNRIFANRVVLGAMEGLFSPSYDGRGEMAAFAEVARKQSWVAVIAFDAICISGDGIVWWRACVIWRNKVVYCVGLLLVTFTLGVLYSFATLFRGSVFTASRADSPNVLVIVGYRSTQVIPTTAIAILATDNIYIKAAGTVSLATNALATALIAFKAWEHRQLVREQFSMAGTKSRVLNALALLIESGSGYSTLLIFMVFYEMDPVPSPDRAGRMFTSVAECIFYGCFAPIAAMYPTVIIVLVALKRSPIDTGGLSRVYQIHDNGAGPGSVDKGTLVFHHSMSCGSVAGDVEVASVEARVTEPRMYPYSCP